MTADAVLRQADADQLRHRRGPGLVQEFQFGMNWSAYSRYVGDIFGAPLAMEGLVAFFLESTFLGLWIFGWDHLKPRVHLAWIWLVAVGTSCRRFSSWRPTPGCSTMSATRSIGRRSCAADVDLRDAHQLDTCCSPSRTRSPPLLDRRDDGCRSVGLAPARRPATSAVPPARSDMALPVVLVAVLLTTRRSATSRAADDQGAADEDGRCGGAVHHPGPRAVLLVCGRRRSNRTPTHSMIRHEGARPAFAAGDQLAGTVA